MDPQLDDNGNLLQGGPHLNEWKDECWYKDGVYHREDGPAVITYDVDDIQYIFYYNGKPHNLNGPAIISSRGGRQYYIDGVKYIEEEWEKEVLIRKLAGVK